MRANWWSRLLERLPELQRARKACEHYRKRAEQLAEQRDDVEDALAEATDQAQQRMQANAHLEARYAALEERLAQMRAERDRWRGLAEMVIPFGLNLDDATEAMRQHQALADRLNLAIQTVEHERRSNATLRGHLTRLRNRLNGPTTAGTARAKGEGDGKLDLDTGAGGVTHEPTQQI